MFKKLSEAAFDETVFQEAELTTPTGNFTDKIQEHDDKIQNVNSLNLTMTQAVKDHLKKEEIKEKDFKEVDKTKKEFIKKTAEDKETVDVSKKFILSESLFEDIQKSSLLEGRIEKVLGYRDHYIPDEQEIVDSDYGTLKTLDNKGDYTLFVREPLTGYTPYVVADWVVKAEDNFIYWAQGHYFKTEEDAREFLASKSLKEDFNDDPDLYQEAFNIFDNIEALTGQTKDWEDKDWTKEKLEVIKEQLMDEVEQLDNLLHALPTKPVEESLDKEITDYCVTVTDNGKKIGEFATEDEADEFIENNDDVELKEEVDVEELDLLDDPTSEITYQFVKAKQITDSNGFTTDYTWYKDSTGKNVFVFGDNDIYTPDMGEFDWEEENDEAAQEWFDNYIGLEEEDNDFLTEEDSIDNQISSNEKTNNNTKIVYYKDKREPLADVMQQDLTTGEWGYIESEKTGKLVPTPISPRVDIPGENVGAFYDDDEQGIIVRVDDESKLEELKEFAQYYDRPFETGYDKHVVGPKYFIKIKLEEKDWDEPYKDSRVHVRSEFVKS